MIDNEAGTTDEPTEYTPDFELAHRGVIREDNWQEYAHEGFMPVPEPYDLAKLFYGIANVYTGDGYDYIEGRPLRHMPGSGVYVNSDGMEHLQAQLRDEDWLRELRAASEKIFGSHEAGPAPS